MNAGNTQESVLAQGHRDKSRPAGTLPPPAHAIAAWPPARPLAAFTAGQPIPGTGSSDRSLATTPRRTTLTTPTSVTPILTPNELDLLLGPRPQEPLDRTESPPRFRSGRLLLLGYHLGAALEESAKAERAPMERPARDRPCEPLGFVLECPATLTFDHETGLWTRHGDPSLLPAANDFKQPPEFGIGEPRSEMGGPAYRDLVDRGLELIRAGDVYQVNLAHRLSAPFEGSARAFAGSLFESAAPAHGFYAEVPGSGEEPTAICSASPELFLSFDPSTRAVRTSPMKGTRPIASDAEELRVAEKDRAELNMITDLMRNDLGRVCEFGSVTVDRARSIEAHGRSVWQATSTVSGTLSGGRSMADLVRATFPPGSVTGAPKIRAMQIIDELEPVGRGFYCGALGWLDDSGAMSLNVAIRTATITGGRLTYHAGAGIVADSEPGAEWAETIEKTEVLRRLSGG